MAVFRRRFARNTQNRDIAEVMKMAIDLRKKVRVIFDDEKRLSQARLSLR